MDVAAAIIENGRGQILLAQRPCGKTLAGFWEFPGGKIEDGESPETALKRELREELNLEVALKRSLGVFPHTYDWGMVRLHVFVVSPLGDPKRSADVQVFRWAEADQIDPRQLAGADVAPLVAYRTGPRDK